MFIEPHPAEQDQHVSRFQQIRNGINNGMDSLYTPAVHWPCKNFISMV